jgi:capsular exopolysaccharide synthesis family protein
MSRISDALKRAGASEKAPGQGTFNSPWSVGGEPAIVSLHPAAPARPFREVEKTPFRGFGPSYRDRLVVSSQNLPLVESFRNLAGTLNTAQKERNIKIVLVTSAIPEDGKTLTAINLALTMSESYGRNVLLIDADLRRPTLHKIAGIGDTEGLSEGLRSQFDKKLTICELGPTLKLLPAGRAEADPISLLSSGRMREIVEEAAGAFDCVILDAPPVAMMSDTTVLSTMADAVLLVIRAGKTPCALAKKTIQLIGEDRILGVVLNGASESDFNQYGYEYVKAGYAPAENDHPGK